jgi:hypothetical protein
MSTARQRCVPGVDDTGPYWLSDPFWSRLNEVESMNLRLRPRPETDSRDPPSKLSARRMDFDAVRQKYCDVIRELEMPAAELDAAHDRRR